MLDVMSNLMSLHVDGDLHAKSLSLWFWYFVSVPIGNKKDSPENFGRVFRGGFWP